MRIIFVGNPGTGKSTLLNGIIGGHEATFRSGVSFGPGLTIELQWKQDPKTEYWYGDTPGLSDVQQRKKAALAITKALRAGEDDYKLVFVITEEAGRVKAVDISTITTVLKAIVEGGAVKMPKYGIIVNKISKKKIKRLHENVKSMENFKTCLHGNYPTDCVHFYAMNDDLHDEDNIVHTITPELSGYFIH